MKEGIVYFARKFIDRQKAALLDLQARQRNSLMRTVAKRKENLEEWVTKWRTKPIEQMIAAVKPGSRLGRRKNFSFIAGEFRYWMDIVTDGIACLAHESLEAKARADRETDKSRVELDLLDEVRHAQERYIEEWHKGWQTAEIQALVATSDRPRSKTNFKLIDKVLMSFGWFLPRLVVAVDCVVSCHTCFQGEKPGRGTSQSTRSKSEVLLLEAVAELPEILHQLALRLVDVFGVPFLAPFRPPSNSAVWLPNEYLLRCSFSSSTGLISFSAASAQHIGIDLHDVLALAGARMGYFKSRKREFDMCENAGARNLLSGAKPAGDKLFETASSGLADVRRG
ncbi:hypothetical protein RHOSPDRAFT_24714 [Rhodotorula sp. JG-1b]|nr:hypothetical protein RHOSPDRAFT_24714 [Rhodotorula sp. JG-1b]